MPAPRVAIYSRHSCDKQNPQSIDDQAAACRTLVERLGGTVVATFTDHDVSGYRRDRPGLMQLLTAVSARQIDIVVCERLDRIARVGEDIGWVGKKLRSDRVRLMTCDQGEINEVKLAMESLLGSVFLTEAQWETFRRMNAAADQIASLRTGRREV
ncbi:recombinase family protein [Sphingomonas sp. TX0543]|uniref:recombinase family protein n=1 Tax=unclassified Sphingomonas TaxID=196159 RepID=UPI00148570B1|nr:recombinase family protein [Sphingomonas sp. 3P27F8]